MFCSSLVLPCGALVLIPFIGPVDFELRALHGFLFLIVCIFEVTLEVRCNGEADCCVVQRGGEEAVNAKCLLNSVSTSSVEASRWLW